MRPAAAAAALLARDSPLSGVGGPSPGRVTVEGLDFRHTFPIRTGGH